MSFLELAKKRYSCRMFSNKKVEQDKIDKILEVALAAPTAINAQPFKIWVIQKESDITKVAQATPFTFGTSTIFAIGVKAGEGYKRKFDGKDFCEIDGAIVTTHMILEIQDLGLGTTWVGHFDPAILKSNFPQMKDYEIVALLPTGYPSEDAAPSDRHAVSKQKNELVSVL